MTPVPQLLLANLALSGGKRSRRGSALLELLKKRKGEEKTQRRCERRQYYTRGGMRRWFYLVEAPHSLVLISEDAGRAFQSRIGKKYRRKVHVE